MHRGEDERRKVFLLASYVYKVSKYSTLLFSLPFLESCY